jgi:hypothetical protein
VVQDALGDLLDRAGAGEALAQRPLDGRELRTVGRPETIGTGEHPDRTGIPRGGLRLLRALRRHACLRHAGLT